MADRSIVIAIGADVSGLINGLRAAEKATESADKKTQSWVGRNQQNLNTLSTGFLTAGAALTGFAALSVSRFAQFDAAMSSVAAATMESAGNMDLLREAAIEAGADTQYSATEAAGAIEELAKAGVSTSDILKGGLTGSLNLAASGAIEVGQAAEIAATAMTQFGLKGDQVSHIADLLAAGAGKAQGGVGDLGMALKQAGLVADQTGLSIEETTAGLTAFAAAGLIGSDAGTSFKSMLQRLTPQSNEAQKEMDRLGISAYDAQGEFVGLATFAGRLQTAMRDLTPEARNAAMATIFGSDAVRAANVLYNEGADGIREWTEAVDDQGYAAEQARIRTDNLLGDLERLGGSFDTALIQSGSAANDVLRDMTQRAESVVDAIGGMPGPILNVTTMLAGGGGLAALGVGALGKVVTSVHETREAFKGLGVSMKTAGALAGGFGLALAAGTFALTAWADSTAKTRARIDGLQSSLDEMTGSVTKSTRAFVASDLYNGTGLMGWAPSVADSAKLVGLSVEDVTDAILGNADAMARVEAASRPFKGDLDGLGKAAEAAGVSMSDYGGAMQIVRDGVEVYTGDLQTAVERQREVKAATDDSTGSVDEQVSALEQYAEAQRAGQETTEQYTNALKDLVDAQRDAAGVVLGLREAQRQWEESILTASEALKENGATLDITTEKGRANQSALDDIASSGWDVIDSMRENGKSQQELQATMQTTRDRFVAVAQQMGMSADEANRLADELGLIPSKVSVDVAVDTSQAMADLNSFRAGVERQQLTIRARVAADPNYDPARAFSTIARAEGGPVYGPGSATSDSIPAWLSNGEWVIKAASVQKYGHAFMASLNAGTAPRFAAGGEVRSVPTAAQYALPSPVAARAAAAPSPASGLTIGTMVVADPREAVKEMDAALKLGMAGVRR